MATRFGPGASAGRALSTHMRHHSQQRTPGAGSPPIAVSVKLLLLALAVLAVAGPSNGAAATATHTAPTQQLSTPAEAASPTSPRSPAAVRRLTASSCSNSLKDGDESDVDCGGSCSAKCTVGQSCATFSDCASAVCGASGCVSSCSVSEWSDYGSCSAICGTGTKARTRTITSQSGDSCEHALTETIVCGASYCPAATSTSDPHVAMAITLAGITEAEFDASARNSFRAVIGNLASVPAIDILIEQVLDVTPTRRLKGLSDAASSQARHLGTGSRLFIKFRAVIREGSTTTLDMMHYGLNRDGDTSTMRSALDGALAPAITAVTVASGPTKVAGSGTTPGNNNNPNTPTDDDGNSSNNNNNTPAAETTFWEDVEAVLDESPTLKAAAYIFVALAVVGILICCYTGCRHMQKQRMAADLKRSMVRTQRANPNAAASEKGKKRKERKGAEKEGEKSKGGKRRRSKQRSKSRRDLRDKERDGDVVIQLDGKAAPTTPARPRTTPSNRRGRRAFETPEGAVGVSKGRPATTIGSSRLEIGQSAGSMPDDMMREVMELAHEAGDASPVPYARIRSSSTPRHGRSSGRHGSTSSPLAPSPHHSSRGHGVGIHAQAQLAAGFPDSPGNPRIASLPGAGDKAQPSRMRSKSRRRHRKAGEEKKRHKKKSKRESKKKHKSSKKERRRRRREAESEASSSYDSDADTQYSSGLSHYSDDPGPEPDAELPADLIFSRPDGTDPSAMYSQSHSHSTRTTPTMTKSTSIGSPDIPLPHMPASAVGTAAAAAATAATAASSSQPSRRESATQAMHARYSDKPADPPTVATAFAVLNQSRDTATTGTSRWDSQLESNSNTPVNRSSRVGGDQTTPAVKLAPLQRTPNSMPSPEQFRPSANEDLLGLLLGYSSKALPDPPGAIPSASHIEAVDVGQAHSPSSPAAAAVASPAPATQAVQHLDNPSPVAAGEAAHIEALLQPPALVGSRPSPSGKARAERGAGAASREKAEADKEKDKDKDAGCASEMERIMAAMMSSINVRESESEDSGASTEEEKDSLAVPAPQRVASKRAGLVVSEPSSLAAAATPRMATSALERGMGAGEGAGVGAGEHAFGFSAGVAGVTRPRLQKPPSLGSRSGKTMTTAGERERESMADSVAAVSSDLSISKV